MRTRADIGAVDRHVGRRIRLRRIALGLSQAEVAGSLGISHQQLGKHERGVDRIGAGRLHAIARRLGVDVAWFFTDARTAATVEGAAGAEKFLADGDGRAIASAFPAINDALVRRQIVDLVQRAATATADRIRKATVPALAASVVLVMDPAAAHAASSGDLGRDLLWIAAGVIGAAGLVVVALSPWRER